MNALPRTIGPLLCLAMAIATASPSVAKPTREQIVAFAETCKAAERRMDLVAEFGDDFTGLDLSGVDFRGYYAVGNKTNLRSANFSNCNLKRAEFGNANLEFTDFTGADLEDASFVTANLRKSTLPRVNLKGVRFDQCDLTGAKLTGADLSLANLNGSIFRGADLSHAILSGAKNDYGWIDFSGADLTRANLSNMRLPGALFQNSTLQSANFSNAELVQADFTRADLTDASFQGANIDAATFTDARGVSDTQKHQLETRSQRWLFEWRAGGVAFARAMYFPAYAFVVIALACLSFRVLRAPNRASSVVVAAVVNALNLVPALFLFVMAAAGSSTTVQFNAGNSVAMELWSAWVQLWPMFVLTLLGCLLVALGAALAFLVTHRRWTQFHQSKLAIAYLALTVAHCLFALHWTISGFPSA